MTADKDDLIVALIVALNALANEAVAYVRYSESDGKFLIAAADRASLLVQASARHLHGEVLQ
jgi:hypothetical protein